MKDAIKVELVRDKGVGWRVYCHEGHDMPTVSKVVVVLEPGQPTRAIVTFLFPEVEQILPE